MFNEGPVFMDSPSQFEPSIGRLLALPPGSAHIRMLASCTGCKMEFAGTLISTISFGANSGIGFVDNFRTVHPELGDLGRVGLGPSRGMVKIIAVKQGQRGRDEEAVLRSHARPVDLEAYVDRWSD